MSETQASSLYAYIVRTDSGFAPNLFWGYCTLACYNPQIRKHANVGDWIVGIGSKSTVGNEKMVYAMKISEKMPFEEYAEDRRFRQKIPSRGLSKNAATTSTSRMHKGTGNNDRRITRKSK